MKCRNRVNLIQFSGGYPPNRIGTDLASLFGIFAVEDVFRARIFEGLDHDYIIA